MPQTIYRWRLTRYSRRMDNRDVTSPRQTFLDAFLKEKGRDLTHNEGEGRSHPSVGEMLLAVWSFKWVPFFVYHGGPVFSFRLGQSSMRSWAQSRTSGKIAEITSDQVISAT